MARTSTASMGKFDKQLDGEKKIHGVKRKVNCCLIYRRRCSSLYKFAPTEAPVEDEKRAALALVSKIDGSAKKTKGDDVVNVRKAIRFANESKSRDSRSVKSKGRRK